MLETTNNKKELLTTHKDEIEFNDSYFGEKINFVGGNEGDIIFPAQKLTIGKNCKIVRITKEELEDSVITTIYYKATLKDSQKFKVPGKIVKTQNSYYLGVMPMGDSKSAQMVPGYEDNLEAQETEKIISEKMIAELKHNWWTVIVGENVKEEEADPKLIERYKAQTDYLKYYQADLDRINNRIANLKKGGAQ